MTDKNREPMSPWMWVLDLLKKQGLSFVLLAFAVWYFYGEVKRLETKADICQSRIIELYQSVILENSDMLKRVEKELSEHNKKQIPKWPRNNE